MALDLSRLGLMVGEEALARLSQARILVCGLGGVGSWAAEALCRCGVGTLGLADFDEVHASNLNRQLPALHSTLGCPKTAAVAGRLRDINPTVALAEFPARLTPENIPALLEERPWSAVLDAVDDRAAKLSLLKECRSRKIPVVTSLGAANLTDPTQLEITTLEKTSGSPLARILRKTLRRENVPLDFPCVASRELPLLCQAEAENPGERRPMGSLVTVTAIAGLLCAHALLRPLLELDQRPRRGMTQSAEKRDES